MGAGVHQMITQDPYVFYRSYQNKNFKDVVVIGLGLSKGDKTLDVSALFNDGDVLFDGYSNQNITVENGKIKMNSAYDVVLISQK